MPIGGRAFPPPCFPRGLGTNCGDFPIHNDHFFSPPLPPALVKVPPSVALNSLRPASFAGTTPLESFFGRVSVGSVFSLPPGSGTKRSLLTPRSLYSVFGSLISDEVWQISFFSYQKDAAFPPSILPPFFLDRVAFPPFRRRRTSFSQVLLRPFASNEKHRRLLELPSAPVSVPS